VGAEGIGAFGIIDCIMGHCIFIMYGHTGAGDGIHSLPCTSDIPGIMGIGCISAISGIMGICIMGICGIFGMGITGICIMGIGCMFGMFIIGACCMFIIGICGIINICCSTGICGIMGICCSAGICGIDSTGLPEMGFTCLFLTSFSIKAYLHLIAQKARKS
jgi:hypothetical protein